MDILERVLSTLPSPAAIRLEAISDIRSTVESFYSSDCGMEYVQVLKDHRSNYYSRTSTASLTSNPHGSITMTSLYQPPQILQIPNNNNSINNNNTLQTNSSIDGNDIESQNPIQQQQQQYRTSEGNSSSSPRSSESNHSQTNNNINNINGNNGNSNNSNILANSTLSRQTLYDIIDLMSESPNHSLLEQLVHSTKHTKLSTELEYVYKQIEENSTWKVIDELADPVLILSGKDPFLILKCSMSWLSMMGCKSSQVFGKIIENFIYFPDPIQENNQSTSATPSTSRLPLSPAALATNSDPNSMTFQEVTSTLEAFYNMLNSANRTSHIHCVLPFQHCTNRSRIKCSIHTFPIFKRLSEEDTPINEKPRYFLQRSSRESTTNINNRNHSIAFYMVYVNNFVVQYDTTPYPAPLVSVDGGNSTPPSVSTTEMSPLSSAISSASITTNITENLRKQGLANDL